MNHPDRPTPAKPSTKALPAGTPSARPTEQSAQAAQSAPTGQRHAKARPAQRQAQAKGSTQWGLYAAGLLAVGAVVVLANLAYDRFLRQPERERAEAVVREAAQIMQERQAQEQAKVVAQTLQMERLRQGVHAGAAMRVAVAEYLADQGRLPDSLAQTTLPDVPPTAVLQAVEIAPGGVVVLRFAPEMGLTGTVTLRPEADLEHGMITRWHCESADFPLIGQALPDCRYIPADLEITYQKS